MKTARKTDQDLVDAEIVRRHVAGETVVAIAAVTNVAKRTVYNVLTRAGVKNTRVQTHLTDAQKLEVVARYATKELVADIAAAYNVNLSTVHNIVKEYGAPKRLNNTPRPSNEVIIEMYLAGATSIDIMQKLEVSESTVTRAVRAYRAAGGELEVPIGRPRS
jgi:transposase